MKTTNFFSKKALCFLVCACIFGAFSFAQELPSGFGGVTLGMSVDAAKEALKKNGDFGYNGDADVSLLPGENRVLIETDAQVFAQWSYLDRCWFQFYEDSLYTIMINFNKKKMDYYSLYSSLVKKYGEPKEFSPERALWENDSIRMTLERPLVIKYIDLKVFNELQSQSRVEKTGREKMREEFLDSL
ncbi:MAG: hypothetical protein MJ169_07345 [Treponema sp.]|nr:hypothetical protein [Treponema sp.]